MSARLFVIPQHVGDHVYFVSNLAGQLNLYSMKFGGSVPVPLLPPHIALQNPILLEGGKLFKVFGKLKQILIMIDKDGDENYQPMLVPLEGGFPEPAFDNFFANYRVRLGECDPLRGIVYFSAERRDAEIVETYQGDLKSGKLTKIAESTYTNHVLAFNKDHTRRLLAEGYTTGDVALFGWKKGEMVTLYGKPMSERGKEEHVPLNGITNAVFSPSSKAALVVSTVFEDTFGLGYLDFKKPGVMEKVELSGVQHKGLGEMKAIEHLFENHYEVIFNIDGCSWVYEGVFNESKKVMVLKTPLVGKKPFDGGVVEHAEYNHEEDTFTFSISTAIEPTQLFTITGKTRDKVTKHTDERILGFPKGTLARGEDASFTSFDGLRISARLYLPAERLGFEGPLPLVYYVHGGPQSQERPDFAWFSMPLIQFLTLRGFAVFVPNVRGSTGYGLSYVKHVDRDWGGQDRLDHVHAMTRVLPQDKRLDVNRAAVVGRSYGGYMTLMLAGMHPELWKASCDMFGPYDLLTFLDRIPETWKPYFRIALGDPKKTDEKNFLVERSPKTHLHNMGAPMLVIQGRNDPRVVAAESEDLARELNEKGKEIELLIFEDEGHDVLKYENRVRCYNAIVDFFTKHLAS